LIDYSFVVSCSELNLHLSKGVRDVISRWRHQDGVVEVFVVAAVMHSVRGDRQHHYHQHDVIAHTNDGIKLYSTDSLL